MGNQEIVVPGTRSKFLFPLKEVPEMGKGVIRAVVVSREDVSISTGLYSVVLKPGEPCSVEFKDKTYLNNLLNTGIIRIASQEEVEEESDRIEVVR